MKPKLLIYSLLIICFACKKNDNAPEKTYRYNKTIDVDSRTRTFTLNLPPSYYDGGDFALVIALHGGGGSATQFESTCLLTEKANASGFIVVYPDGVQSPGALAARTWNAGGCCSYAATANINDVNFIRQMIAQLTNDYNIDPKRVYATGHSNGGMLCYRLACELSDKIAAIAPNGCTMVVNQPCNPGRAVPILQMHSILDTNVPFSGGIGTGPSNHYNPPLDSVLNAWSLKNGCTTTAQVLQDNSEYKLTQWSGCNSNAKIQYYLTKDGGHAWPGGLPGSQMGDNPSTVIEANDLLWNFFQQYQLP